MAEVKKRQIRKADWDKVERFVSDIYEDRKKSTFRTEHQNKWTEIDRQIAMNPLKRIVNNKEVTSWHAALELGELSKASEIITSDTMRILFPSDKSFFQPHVNLPWPTGQDGKPAVDSAKQKIGDGLLRNLMVQQHQDFGFKSRVRLSIKEALHHGSFVAEVRFEERLMAQDGGKVKMVGAPVWRPYSMWNSYPDPSPALTGTDMFYDGTMILVDYMPLWKLKDIAKGDGWMKDRLAKVEKEEHKTKAGKTDDVELVKFYGDISIDRSDGDIFLPNSKVILANNILVYWEANDLPYPPIIHGGYERQDIRDPYYTSPIIKQSPIQKAASVTMNKFLDAQALKVEPPIEYDGNDPDYVANGGPTIAPGVATPTKSMGKGFQALDIGDPAWALKALEMFLRQEQEGTGVSALRSGTTNSDRQTAFEVNKVAQGAEVRTVEFVAQLEPALRSFLYMQHELNRKYMNDYEFYNDELHTPDVIIARNEDIQENAFFEVVGTRGLLGEEQRKENANKVTAFAAQSPLFAPLLKADQILQDMYRDAGKKNPEDWVKVGPQTSPQEIAMQQQMQQLQQLLQKFAAENEKLKQDHEAKMAKIMADSQTSAQDRAAEQKRFAAELQEQKREFNYEFQLKTLELKNDMLQIVNDQANQANQATEKVDSSVRSLERLADKQTSAIERASEKLSEVTDKVVAIETRKTKRKVTAPSGRTYTIEEP